MTKNSKPKKEERDSTSYKKKTSRKPSEIHPLLRITLIFLIIILSVIILYYAKSLLIPLTIAAILAMMLNPVMDNLLKIGLPKWLAITSLSLLLIIIGAGVFFLIGRQIGVVSQDWHELKDKLLALFNKMEQFIQETFHINPNNQESKAVDSIPFGSFIMKFIGSFTNILTDGFLVLIYLILMLSGRKQFKKLLLNLSKNSNKENTSHAIDECIKVASKYLFGRIVMTVIIILIYGIGFWIGNVPYFLFLALIAGILSIIPFLGNIVGGIIVCLLTLITGGVVSMLIALGIIIIGQIIGDYVLTPWILGDAVRLNPFMTIFSVIAFTILWGPIGAIFALPLVAMLRILFQTKQSTSPYAAFLMGDT